MNQFVLIVFCSLISATISGERRAIYGPFFGKTRASKSFKDAKINMTLTDGAKSVQAANVGGVKSGVKGSSPVKRSICDTSRSASEFRLPSNVIPKHYNLELDIDLKTLTFTGKESIFIKFDKMRTRKAKDVIKLHSVELNLTKITLFLSTKSDQNGIEGQKNFTRVLFYRR